MVINEGYAEKIGALWAGYEEKKKEEAATLQRSDAILTNLVSTHAGVVVLLQLLGGTAPCCVTANS